MTRSCLCGYSLPFRKARIGWAGFVLCAAPKPTIQHLTKSQRASIAARVANMPAHRPKSANLRTSEPQLSLSEQVARRQAMFTSKRKEAYLRKHPETGHGKATADKEDNLSSFDKDQADKTGVDARTVRQNDEISLICIS